jgi:serine/threonine protein kinase
VSATSEMRRAVRTSGQMSDGECSQCRSRLVSHPGSTLELRCWHCRPRRRSLVPAGSRPAFDPADSNPCKDWQFPREFSDRYRLVGNLGRGAAGVVVEAVQTSLDRRVAIKFLAKPSEVGSIQRLVQEGKILARIKSEYVVKIFEQGEVLDSLYLVIELLKEGSLRSLLDRCGILSFAESIRIIEPVLKGLHDCHRMGVIHRDIKPENILFNSAVQPKLVDLGIARILGERQHLTASGALIGTAGYLAPERIAGGAEGPSFDLYSVAVVLYEMVTGRRPFQGDNLSEVILAQRQLEPPDARQFVPHLPAPAARFLSRALSRSQDERPLSAREFIDALREAHHACLTSGSLRLARSAVTRKSSSVVPKTARFCSKSWRSHTMLVLMLLLILGVLLPSEWCHRTEPRKTEVSLERQ